MDILDKIDNYYNNKKPSEVWLLTLLIALLVGYLLYTLLSTPASNFRTTQEKRNMDLKNKISSHESYLKAITVNGDRDYYIKDLTRKILKEKVALNDYRAKLNKLNLAMKELKELVYTKDNWSEFLHGITKKAEDNNLKISSITNTNYEQNNTFSKVLDVNIKAKGKYGDILAFMNSLEQTKLVTNISSVSLGANRGKPSADINLSVWSIRP